MDEAINGNLSVRAVADTTRMEWVPSPSGSVWRKRVHLVGPPESGQVTSVVRYEPDSRFPAHDHPEGEEILVLEGEFADETRAYSAGCAFRLVRSIIPDPPEDALFASRDLVSHI